MTSKILLNVGSGNLPHRLGDLPNPEEWQEVHVDNFPYKGHEENPNFILSDVRKIPVPDNYANCVYASHILEHFYEHEIVDILKEWHRVLKDQGNIVILVPNIPEAWRRALSLPHVSTPLYKTEGNVGITVWDMTYGYREEVRTNNAGMAHKTGFSPQRLAKALRLANFYNIDVQCPENGLEILGTAWKHNSDGFETNPEEQTKEL